MKVMISQPMAGKTTEQIRAERQIIVDGLKKLGHEVVDTIFTSEPPSTSNKALWCLGGALRLMSYCDAVLFMKGWDKARGCRIEHAAALEYDLQLWTESDLYPRY